ncbi:hypothetical protein SAMN05661093_10207 [Kibdelosporangium aridum]|uniref:Uncharacterized protein n=1 Tax=Kibdelosporangium aridum TaxID=2030 RepID=A0A1W2FXV8_KIBAR|nr:hypothetical protein SAMN05661093_10207 [Kibdelosporangium aridum]
MPAAPPTTPIATVHHQLMSRPSKAASHTARAAGIRRQSRSCSGSSTLRFIKAFTSFQGAPRGSMLFWRQRSSQGCAAGKRTDMGSYVEWAVRRDPHTEHPGNTEQAGHQGSRPIKQICLYDQGRRSCDVSTYQGPLGFPSQCISASSTAAAAGSRRHKGHNHPTQPCGQRPQSFMSAHMKAHAILLPCATSAPSTTGAAEPSLIGQRPGAHLPLDCFTQRGHSFRPCGMN